MPEQMTDGGDRQATRGAGLWPVAIVAMLVVQVAICAIVIYFSSADSSFAVEPDYYDKAVRWDEHVAQVQRNATLGWSVELEFGDTLGPVGEREISLTLRDRQGRPVEGAAVELELFPHARGNQRTRLQPAPAEAAGVYSSKMRFNRKGLWEFRFVVRRAADTFTHVVTRNVYPPGEPEPWRF